MDVYPDFSDLMESFENFNKSTEKPSEKPSGDNFTDKGEKVLKDIHNTLNEIDVKLENFMKTSDMRHLTLLPEKLAIPVKFILPEKDSMAASAPPKPRASRKRRKYVDAEVQTDDFEEPPTKQRRVSFKGGLGRYEKAIVSGWRLMRKMVDASLDDYIRGNNNFQIQIRNDNQRSQSQAFKGKRPKELVITSGQRVRNPDIEFPGRNKQTFNVTLGGNTKGIIDARQKISTKGVIDARQKISQRKKISLQQDARQNIVSKGQVLDARSKITNLKIKRGMFDAREKIKIQKPPKPEPDINVTGIGTVTIANPGTICRTVNNTGNSVELNEGNIQITRSLDGSLHSSNVPLSQFRIPELMGNFQITKSVPQNYEVPHVNPLRGPVIQVKNEQYTGGVVINNDYIDENVDLGDDTVEHLDSLAVRDLPIVSKTINKPTNSISSGATGVRGKKVVAVKRRAPISQPLLLSKTTKLPANDELDEQVKAAPALKKMKSTSVVRESVDVVEQMETESADILSPLQGFKVLVTNLHTIVTQDDIIELFGSVGALKKAKLLKQGSAEVVYVKREDALRAEKKYHTRELDGQPMHVKLVTPASATIKEVDSLSSGSDAVASPLKLAKNTGTQKEKITPDVELPLIHRALFKTGAPASTKPVTFTVKI